MAELNHANHTGISFSKVGSEARGVTETIHVFYDAGWPASRPSTTHVVAVGHTSAPVWLTADDIWLEAV